MNATVLVDNMGEGVLRGEHGLSFYITFHDHHLLLDAGKSSLFLKNAFLLGIDLKTVDSAVLSHAHYDHANGMDAFLRLNAHAPLYLQNSVQPNCYKSIANGQWHKYIGIPYTLLAEHEDRIRRVGLCEEIADDIFLLGHTTKDLCEKGHEEHMAIRVGSDYEDDDFAHEQSLVFKTTEGLVIFNSCCHAGADRIVQEVQIAFPDLRVHTLVGGFHLKDKTDEEVLAFAERLNNVGLSQIYTGHCTGAHALRILQNEIHCPVHPLHSGLVLDLPLE